MTLRILVLAFAVCGIPLNGFAFDKPDVVFANFEDETYGEWKATGTAFGTGPAEGTLPGQMHVSGFKGKRLVNSFRGGDKSTGTLTSPGFIIIHKHIRFLIGGGTHEGKTCMNLVIDGKTVRTATGPNDQPGGSEALIPESWDVSEYQGKTAQLIIVDSETGGWGHINIDEIVFSDQPAKKPIREIVIDNRYLLFPVKNKGAVKRVKVLDAKATIAEFTIELADSDPDWWAPLDVSRFQGRTLQIHVNGLPEASQGLSQIKCSVEAFDKRTVYSEPLRPQIHFSPRNGWNNDPNGMVYSQGEWHLYFQHNPYGVEWGNMHWGHAVSKDLVHWTEYPIAISPMKFGDWAFSGSAVVDHENTSGWKRGSNDLLVAAYTSTGRGECMVYSNDRGRTWIEYEGNPVVKHQGRDPKLFWHAPSKKWVMAVYDEFEKKQWIAFYTSQNLKDWTYQSRIEGFYECPDLFELPVDGDNNTKKWILTAANSDYMIGSFDGSRFKPETKKIKGVAGKGFYAAQTFTNTPDSRIIQIGWLQAPSPGMSFNQAMSIPLELGLKTTPEGQRLTWKPVTELTKLRLKSHRLALGDLKPGNHTISSISGDALELQIGFAANETTLFSITIRGVPITYDAKKQELQVATHRTAVPLQNGKVELTIMTDRTAFEVFMNDGLVYCPCPVIPKQNDKPIILTTSTDLKLSKLQIHELRSIWKPD